MAARSLGSDSYEGQRIALGRTLHLFRRAASMTGMQLSSITGVSQSKISKLEHGLLTPSDEDIQLISDALKLQHQQKLRLLRLLRNVRTEYSNWRVSHARGLASKQRQIADLESGATTIRVFQTSVIPGLLQVPEYAECILELANCTGQSDVRAGVRARLARAQVLFDSMKHFHFLFTELAVRSPFCPHRVTARQLERVISLNLPNVSVGVLTHDTEWTVIPQNGFCIFDDTFVLVETTTAEIQVSATADVAHYLEVFAALDRSALHGEAARNFLVSAQQLLEAS